MAMDFGLPTPSSNLLCKRKFRWLLKIDGVSGQIGTLPPMKSARPSLSFREMEIKHLTETIYYPARPEWKPIQLVLYDVSLDGNPIFDWIKKVYDPEAGDWFPVTQNKFLKDARLEMYDGCGNIIEKWTYENAWPQVAEFGELDMGNHDVVTCDLTLRYARAFIG